MAAEFKIGRLRFTWAGVWATGVTYARDNVIQYNGKVYACLTPHTSSSFYNDINVLKYWNLIAEGKTWIGPWVSSTSYSLGNLVSYGGEIYTCTTPNNDSTFTSSKWTTWTLFDKWNNAWAPNYTYGVGDVVKYGGIVYRCNLNHISATYVTPTYLGLENDQSKWTIVDSGYEYKGAWTALTRYKQNDLVKVGPNVYQCSTYHTSSSLFASSNWTMWIPGVETLSTYNSSTYYQVGDEVSYGGYNYVSKTSNNYSNIPSTDGGINWTLLDTGYGIKGIWTGGLSAKVGDIVQRNGQLFIATADNNSVDPSSAIISTTYTSSGSSGTTLKVASTSNLAIGMVLTGVGFTQGQTIVSVVDLTTLLLNAGPNGTPVNGQSLSFAGVTSTSWQLLVSGNYWTNRWVLNTSYVVGDIVTWQNFTYSCVQNHTALLASRPDNDTTRVYWQYVVAQAQKNSSTSTGDLQYYSSATGKYTALPIGTDGYALRVSSTTPSWAKLNVSPSLYYVATNGIDRSDYGTNWDQPWKTIQYAVGILRNGTQNPNAVALLNANKSWILAEMLQWAIYQVANNLTPFSTTYSLDQTKTTRDAGYIIDAIVYDIGRGGNSQTVAAATAYFAYGSTNTFFSTAVAADVPFYLPILNRLLTLITNALNQTSPGTSYQTLNNTSNPVSQTIGQTAAEGTAVTTVTSLFSIITLSLTNQNTSYIPSANTGLTATIMVKTGTYSETLPITVPENVAINGDELRGVVVQPAVIINTVATGCTTSLITVVTTAGMTANCPVQFGTSIGGLTAATTYYVIGSSITGTQFSVSLTSGGATPIVLTATTNKSITVYGGDAVKNMFLLRNGSGLRNMSLTGLLGFLQAADIYGIQRPSGGAYSSLDPGTGPNDTTAWIFRRSPYCQNISMFGIGCTGLKIDGTLHNGGNKSIVSNDYTTIISDGIGIWCTGSGALTEAVSVFNYYGYMGYFAENGGRMRATNGNSSYGTYGCVALGFDLTEAAATGIVFNRSQQIQASVQSSLGSTSQLIKLNYSNAGNNYTTSTTNLLNYSNLFTASWTTDGNVTLQKNILALTGYTEAWTLTGTTSGTDGSYIYQNIAIPAAGGVFTNVPGTTITGSGSSATFDVTVTSTAYTVVVNQGGSNYATTNIINISGSVFGGIAGTNDLTLTVYSLSGSSITSVTVSGTVPTSAAQSYTCSLYVYAGTSSNIDLYAMFSGSSSRTSSLNYNFTTGSKTPSSANGGFLPINYGVQSTTVTGWYRMWMAVNDTTGQNTQLQFRIYPRGYSAGTANQTSIVYGAQVELSTSTFSPSFYLETQQTRYTSYANFQVVGSGSSAYLLGDETRSGSIFESRVVDSGSGAGGNGYLTASNNAQAGNATQITLAQADTRLSSNYVTMRLFINSGTGAGQYGYISSFNSTTKVATILRESFDVVLLGSCTTTAFTVVSNIDSLYSGLAIQFVPTYYTVLITGTNLGQQTVTSIQTAVINNSITSTLTVTNAYAFYVNMPINFTGTIFTSLTSGYTYYVQSIVDSTTITVSTTISGTSIFLTTGTGSFTINYPTNTGALSGNMITSNMVVNLPITFTGTALGGVSVGTAYYIQDVIDTNSFTITSNLITVTPTVASSSAFTVVSSTSLIPMNPIVFSGTPFGGVTTGQKYYISSLPNTTSFAISTTLLTVTVNRTYSGSNLIQIDQSVAFFVANQPIIFYGNTFGGILKEHVYYILAIDTGANTFTICDVAPNSQPYNLSAVFPATGVMYARTCGSPLGLTAGSGSMTGTSSGSRFTLSQGSGTMNGTFSTVLFGGVTQGTTYYVDTVTSTTVSIKDGSNAPITLTTGAGSMNIGAVGWDHVVPGTPILSLLDNSSLYYIEPRLQYADPAFTQTTASAPYTLTLGTYNGMAYGAGYFIAIPSGGAQAARSLDGSSWTALSLPTAKSWTGITYGAGYFVMIAGTTFSGDNSVLYSANNGNGWRSSTLPVSSNWKAVTYGNGTFVAVANGTAYSAYSTNFGQTWTQSAIKGKKTATVFGTAKLSTTQKQFGATSLALNGTTDYITFATSTDFGFSTGDFTVEAFFYHTTGGTFHSLFDFRTLATEVSVFLAVNASDKIYLYVNGSVVTTTTVSLPLNAWTHVALVRSSGTTSIYVNGTQSGTPYSDTNDYGSTKPLSIGADRAGANFFPGYIDEVRISKATARYTTTFTLPTLAFVPDAQTSLLLNFDGLNNSTIITTSESWTSVAYGSGLFVAITTASNTAAYSTDGITWTATTLPSTTAWSSITYGNGRFVAVSSATGPAVASAYSFNGTTWYSSNIGITSTQVIYGQGVFLAVNSSSSSAYTSEEGLNWKLRTVSTSVYNAGAFGTVLSTGAGAFALLGGASTGSSITAGVRAKGRPSINTNVMNSISHWEPGSGYTFTPTLSVTDPNVTVLANILPRLGNGSLGGPTFINRGTGYNNTSTVINITGNGYSDAYQTGYTIILNNMSRLPLVGDNLTISGIPQIYKVTSASPMYGTTAPNIEANVQISPAMTTLLSPTNGTTVSVRTKYSQVRLTGHDFLYIGTGNQSVTNYPSGVSINNALAGNQTVELNYGRVFFTSTDQDGNFKVGNLFGVQQATGIVTLSASQFGLSGLSTLSLGGVALGSSGVVIQGFSTDGTFTANTDSVIPTQKAIKTYLTSRLTQGGANTTTGQLTAGTIVLGNATFIASTITNGLAGSSVKMQSKVYINANGVDGNMAALDFFMRNARRSS